MHSPKVSELSAAVGPLTKSLIDGLVGQSTYGTSKALAPELQRVLPYFADPNSTGAEALDGAGDSRGALLKALPHLVKESRRSGGTGSRPRGSTLMKSLQNNLDDTETHRLSFKTDPTLNTSYASIYKAKMQLLPDSMLKKVARQDDLTASIINTRSAQVQAFGRPQPDRFSTGFKLVPEQSLVDKMDPADKKKLEEKIDACQKRWINCGDHNWPDADRLSFTQYLGMTVRNAVTVGRLATELVWADQYGDDKKVLKGFRAIDAGTIYQAVPYSAQAESVRKEALALINALENTNFEPERFKNDEYAWIQVINGKPVQALTERECVVHNFYPSADVELGGYPVTPIDTAIAAITTHINITTHNRLYFENGRATRGMLVIKSDDVSPETAAQLKHHFQASINSASKSWRMPVFAVGSEEEVSWQAIDTGTRDMEFQYLSDMNARVIMSAFQISPEELPGYAHLSRGTNSQALSEGNNEYKLEAARDVGIRPLIAQLEDFLNTRIFPALDPELSKICVIKLVGLDSDTPEKESTRIQQDMNTWMTFDDVLKTVEKTPVGPAMGGALPLNQAFQAKIDAYLTVGEILEFFFGRKDASKNPDLQYMRDPFWFQFQELKLNMAQAQAQAQQPPPDGGGGGGGEGAPPKGGSDGQDETAPDLTAGLDQVLGMLTKSEAQLPPSRRRLLEKQRQIVVSSMKGMDDELKDLTRVILNAATKEG